MLKYLMRRFITSVLLVAAIFIVVFFALLSYQPATVLFAIFVAYSLSGYVVSAWLALRKRRAAPPPAA